MLLVIAMCWLLCSCAAFYLLVLDFTTDGFDIDMSDCCFFLFISIILGPVVTLILSVKFLVYAIVTGNRTEKWDNLMNKTVFRGKHK